MRRRRAWADTRFAGATIAASATIKSDLLAGLAATETKTVSRIIGDVSFFRLVAAAETDFASSVDVAIGVVSKEAFDLETLPDPDATSDYPQQGWMYVSTQPVWQIAAADGLVSTAARFAFDIRGQRKVDRGVLFMTFLNISITNGPTLTIVGRVRALCLT